MRNLEIITELRNPPVLIRVVILVPRDITIVIAGPENSKLATIIETTLVSKVMTKSRVRSIS